jgi:ATPase subunit of ABC transporter with duplicated ATPase domains
MAMSLALLNASFVLNNGQTLFQNISFSLKHRVNAFVGINGVGKSVLAQLISRRLALSDGHLQCNVNMAYVPQLWTGPPTDSVWKVLGLEEPLAAIKRIENGSHEPDDFELAEPWWDWEAQLQAALDTTGFPRELITDRAIGTYSGGEQFRLSWAAALITQPDVYMLDEPTNHLDREGRQILLSWIRESKTSFIVVSHDREFLQAVDAIYELTPNDLFYHPGNYENYFAAKQQRWKSQNERLGQARSVEKRTAAKAQEALEKQQQRVANGKARAKKENWSVLERNGAKEAGEVNLRKQKTLRDNRSQSTEAERKDAEFSREWFDPVGFSLPDSVVSSSKTVLTTNDLTVGYDSALTQPLNIHLNGPFRLHIVGANGSGKSALIKTILGQVKPFYGRSSLHVDMAYLDQHFTAFAGDKTAIENVCIHQETLTEKEGRDRLAWLRLRNTKADVPFRQLSGGEQLKVALASKLLGHKTPKLLILDEPANHLDLDSIIALEQALETFKGAMIIVSHDELFTKQQKITHVLNLENNELSFQ